MERTSAHQMLPLAEQERLAKEKIEELLKGHNLGENVNLIYLIIRECGRANNGDKIDLCVDKIVREFEGQQQETEANEAEQHSKQYDIYSKT